MNKFLMLGFLGFFSNNETLDFLAHIFKFQDSRLNGNSTCYNENYYKSIQNLYFRFP